MNIGVKPRNISTAIILRSNDTLPPPWIKNQKTWILVPVLQVYDAG